MQTLLDNVDIIDQKYEKLRKLNKFNIFSILRSKTDEVNLHSKFIKELLDPKGIHGESYTFLNSFLKTCGLNPDNYPNARVSREWKKIDILIRSGSKAIIIENKIWAPDQKLQLERYYATLTAEKAVEIHVIYLTLDGKEPSDESRGILKKDSIQLLSYKYVIYQWLEDCITQVKDNILLRETLVQYKNLVGELTGNTMSHQEKSELLELMKSDDNIVKAAKIVENWNYVRVHTEWNFWKELKEVIAQFYTILPVGEVNWNKVRDLVEMRADADPWYGIMIKLLQIECDEICLFIQRGRSDLYFGITVLGNGYDRTICSSKKYTKLAQKLGGLQNKQDEKWLDKKPFATPINFELFNSDLTVKLIQPEFRKSYIDQLFTEIKDYIITCELETCELPVDQSLT